MKERPILFNDEMVRAILGGKKTQTRRVIKPLPTNRANHVWADGNRFAFCEGTHEKGARCQEDTIIKHRYGVPGDRLWVREIFAMQVSLEPGEVKPFDDGRPFLVVDEGPEYGTHWEQPHYRATDPAPDLCYEDQEEEGPCVRWLPQLHMPRWASRILLEVQEVRAERVQDITEEDAQAEGVECVYSMEFAKLWDSINGKKPGRSWKENPWVWVITFRKM